MGNSTKHLQRVKCYGLAAIMLFAFISSASAMEGDVLATLDLKAKGNFNIFGNAYQTTDVRWRINRDTVDIRGLQAIEKKDAHNHRYACLDGAALNARVNRIMAVERQDLQIASARVLGTMRMVSKGRYQLNGRDYAANDIVWNPGKMPYDDMKYALVKTENSIQIAHTGRLDKRIRALDGWIVARN